MDARPGASAPVDPRDEPGPPAELVPPDVEETPVGPGTVPPVVAVVVTHNPGPWFDDCLAGLAAQTYSGLSVLFIDAASDEDPTPRIARRLPGAYVRRLDTNPGYGPATNEALGMVEGAAFYLLCHDDVALAPNAVRAMVEESFRSNAGLAGPKAVRWDQPELILDVGSTADKTGVRAPYAEPGELDQEQHDGVRDVFLPADGCLLVRADLLEHLGGFDPGADYYGESLDLAWRAHVAGARVLTVPAAEVRHRQGLEERSAVAASRRRLVVRHRVRTMLTCYRPPSLLWVVPQALFVSLIEAVYALLSGHTSHAREVAGAWTWNLRRLGQLRDRRKVLARSRTVPDRDVRRLQVRGSARVQSYVRGRARPDDDRLVTATRAGRDLAGSFRAGPRRTALLATLLTLGLLVLGSRELITGDIPAIGEFAAFRSGPGFLFQEWLSGWRSSGLGSESPAPTGFGLLGVLGTLFAGAMGFLRKVLILGPLPVGALGAWRLARPIGSRRAAVVAFVVYLAIPVPYNSLATGSWGGLLLFAAAPWMVLTLAKASNLAPFATEPRSVDVLGPAGEHHATLDAEAPKVTEGPTSTRYLVSRVLGLGLLLALVATVVPFVLVVTVLAGLGLVLGSLVAARVEGLDRIAIVSVGAPVVALVLHLPWSLEFFESSGWSTFSGTRASENGLLAVGRLLRFQSGPFGAPPLGWFLLVAAALPLVIGRGWRFEWAVRAWFMALVSWGVLWASHEGWLGVGLPPAEILLAPAATGLALAAALGMAAFEIDLPGYRFGWRQALSVVAAVSVVLGTSSIFAGVVGGRWKMPGGDLASTLDFIDTERDAAPFRVLWAGDPEVLPLAGWRIDDRLALATTDEGLPTIESLWTSGSDGPSGLLGDSVALARERRTARLGRILGSMGVRYVVVPLRRAPASQTGEVFGVPPDLISTLDQQLDLERVDINDAVVVYRNRAWLPTRAGLPADQPLGSDFTDAAGLDLAQETNVLPRQSGPTSARGEVGPGEEVLLAEAASGRWRLTVDGEAAERDTTLGWANRFAPAGAGTAELTYRTSPLRYVFLIVQVALWALVFACWRLFRRRPDPELSS